MAADGLQLVTNSITYVGPIGVASPAVAPDRAAILDRMMTLLPAARRTFMKRWLAVAWLAMMAIACGKTETVVRVQKADGSAVIGQVTRTASGVVVRDRGGQDSRRS